MKYRGRYEGFQVDKILIRDPQHVEGQSGGIWTRNHLVVCDDDINRGDILKEVSQFKTEEVPEEIQSNFSRGAK